MVHRDVGGGDATEAPDYHAAGNVGLQDVRWPWTNRHVNYVPLSGREANNLPLVYFVSTVVADSIPNCLAICNATSRLGSFMRLSSFGREIQKERVAMTVAPVR